MVGFDTGAVNDKRQLGVMVEQVKQNLNIDKMNVLADKGYHTGEQIDKCEQLNATTFVSPKANAANSRFKVFPMEQFDYNKKQDTYKCPAGQTLKTNGRWYKRKGQSKKSATIQFKAYKTKACLTCPIKDQCTASERGRILQRSEYQDAVDRNNNRVTKNPNYYRLRQQLIEHQFGTFKRHWGFTHTLMKTKENVLSEVAILFTTYNLRRSLSIFGFNELLSRLKACFSMFLAFFVTARFLMADTIKQSSEPLWRTT